MSIYTDLPKVKQEGGAHGPVFEDTKMLRMKSPGSLILALSLGLVFSASASAQDFGGGGAGEDPTDPPADISPPPDKLSVTETGVDIRTGRFAYSKTDLQAGSLSLVRQLPNDARGHIHPFQNMSHNWDIFITERRFDMTKGLPPAAEAEGAGNDFQLHVHYNGSKQVFEARQNSTASGHDSSASGYLTVSGSRGSSSAVYGYQALDGTVLTFRPIGSGDCSTVYRCAYVSKIERADGEIITFSYDTGGTPGHGGRLSKIETNRGFAILLDYAGSGNWHSVRKACIYNTAATFLPTSCSSAALQTVTYSFNGRLASVTDANGAVWQYGYSGDQMRFYNPGETAPYLTNTLRLNITDQLERHDIVMSQARADGLVVGYSYNYAPFQSSGLQPSYPHYPTLAGGIMSDNAGRSSSIIYGFPIVPGTWQGGAPGDDQYIYFGDIQYQTTPGPELIRDPLGREWRMDYCDPVAAAGYPSSENHRCLVSPYLLSFTNPEGDVTEYKYDSRRTRNIIETRRKPKPGSSLPDIVTTATYSCLNLVTCKKPLSTTDANGNVTNYEYDPVHGGLLKKTLPADENGIRPQTRYSWHQQHSWIKNSSGGYSPAASAVWVLSSEEFCKTTAAVGNGCAGGASDEVVTTYQYEAGNSTQGSNSFRVGVAVTADGQTLRTCYRLDEFGRTIAEVQPKAGLATCRL